MLDVVVVVVIVVVEKEEEIAVSEIKVEKVGGN